MKADISISDSKYILTVIAKDYILCCIAAYCMRDLEKKLIDFLFSEGVSLAHRGPFTARLFKDADLLTSMQNNSIEHLTMQLFDFIYQY
jgi:hypothetical protein